LYDLVDKNRNEPWAKEVEDEITKKLMKRHHGSTDISKRRKRRRNNQDQEEVQSQMVVAIKARSGLGSTAPPTQTRAV
jgi:hypothetical protein